jgi:hypothetical protein
MTSNIPPALLPPRGTWPAWRPTSSVAEAAELAARSRRRLRRQGVVRSLVGLVISALLVLWKPLFAAIVAAITVLVLLVALLTPDVYARLAGGLERFGRWLGSAVTWILMPLIFAFLFLPVGVLLRSAGKLRITRRPDPALATYWETPPAGQSWGGGGSASYRRQF